jgi:predicted ATPase
VSQALPSGTVTLLFTDVEGSTKLLHEIGSEAYAQALAEHRRLLRDAFTTHRGVEVDTQGDAFLVAFANATDAVAAARAAQQFLASGPIQVRMGLHTGAPKLVDEGYVGEDVHLGARIAAAGHGGQVLLSKATRKLVDGELIDLGEHRLKDFTEPVWIFQLGSERFPPLKTISNTNLPRPASSFVGRDRELAEVTALLHDRARFVTLSGPGGSGKTRLAMEAAAELVSDFRNGIFWVGLAPLRDPALVSETIAQTLGAKDGLREYIGERELLLLLDNFEQVVEAAPELAALVEACPNLRLLVTSRELLRVRGEVEYPVLPLADADAVELFSERARVERDETVIELCRRLDNLPLALELAAARTNILSPRQILDRISQRIDLLKGGRDAEPRQETLRATIEWSYELLGPGEQQLLAGLAVFRGGCTIDAAEQVSDADLDALQSLVAKSLLRHSDERFWMLETIRDYATERLVESGEADRLRRRHAEHFVALVEDAEVRLRKGDRDAIERLDRDHDNLRAALDTLEASAEFELARRLAGAAYWYWVPRGYVAEGRRRIERLLRDDERPTTGRAKALNAAAELAASSGDAVAARLHAEEALALHRKLGDRWGAALSLFQLADAATLGADIKKNEQQPDESRRLYLEAQQFYERVIGLFEKLGDEHFALMAMYALAYTQIELGDDERGRALRERILERARAAGDEHVEALTLGGLVRFAFIDDRLEDALALLKESIRIWLRLGELRRVALLLGRFAYALARMGDAERATKLLARSLALFEEIGSSIPWTAAENEATLHALHASLDEGSFAEAWRQGTNLSIEEAVTMAVGESACSSTRSQR